MLNEKLQQVMEQYSLKGPGCLIEPYGKGLINHTWLITTATEQFILQKINTAVFKNPSDIDHNINLVSDYLKTSHPDYLFVKPVSAANSKTLLNLEGNYFRMFPFVSDSSSIDIIENPEQAYSAAKAFGKLTRLLSGMDVSKLRTSIPHFHDLSLRYDQFLRSLETGIKERIDHNRDMIEKMKHFSFITDKYKSALKDPDFKIRVTHHDTKISNVLFVKNKAACVIDLDTLMPGYFFSDVGDMIRTYMPTVNEEEKDLANIRLREDVLNAIREGYMSEMVNELTEKESSAFFFAGQMMIYMQTLRFMTDYLSGDTYYKTVYEDQNRVRALNQLHLLEQYSFISGENH